MPPLESHAPAVDNNKRYRTVRTDQRSLNGKRQPSLSRTAPSKCARTESPVPRTTPPVPPYRARSTAGCLPALRRPKSTRQRSPSRLLRHPLRSPCRCRITPTRSHTPLSARSHAHAPARWHPRPPAGMPDCPTARLPLEEGGCLHPLYVCLRHRSIPRPKLPS